MRWRLTESTREEWKTRTWLPDLHSVRRPAPPHSHIDKAAAYQNCGWALRLRGVLEAWSTSTLRSVQPTAGQSEDNLPLNLGKRTVNTVSLSSDLAEISP
jgi:hypothetical protein